RRRVVRRVGAQVTRALVAATLEVLGGCQPKDAWTTPVSGLDPILLSVWGSSKTDLWAAGGTCIIGNCTAATSKSLVLHGGEGGWTEMNAGATAVLWWVFGFGPSDVWFAGEQGTILHYDGKSFVK